ncbi:RNase A-like domain-containing protein, partial [Pseudomonas proteolytica]
DRESGLHYNRHRYYNPDNGRYLTPDPVKLAGGVNGYLYVPNPTGWVDPLGLACKAGNCPDSKGKANSGVLTAHEKGGGHLIKKHVARTDEELAERFDSEPNIPASSTFQTLEEAETIVSKSLATHHQEIRKFLNGNKSKLLIRDSSTQPVGRSLLKGAKNSVAAYKFLLVLKRSPKMPDGYLLLTGYPEK